MASSRKPNLDDEPLLPKGNTNLNLYRPMEGTSDRHVRHVIEALWQLSIKLVSLPVWPKRRANPDPSVFLVETSDGNYYEYTYTSTRDLTPGLHFLRRVYRDGSRGPWEEASAQRLQEAIEKNDMENRKAGWGQLLKPITEREKATFMGLKELKWMHFGGKARCHAAVFWLDEQKPEIETEEQRSAFMGRFKEHENICGFEGRKCD